MQYWKSRQLLSLNEATGCSVMIMREGRDKNNYLHWNTVQIAEPGQESQIARQAASGRGKISNDWKHGQCVGIAESCAATHPCRTHDTLISLWGWGPAPMAGQTALQLLTAFSKFYWKLRLDLTLFILHYIVAQPYDIAVLNNSNKTSAAFHWKNPASFRLLKKTTKKNNNRNPLCRKCALLCIAIAQTTRRHCLCVDKSNQSNANLLHA